MTYNQLTWLILHISIPQPHHSGHCVVAFTILRGLIETLLGLTVSTSALAWAV